MSRDTYIIWTLFVTLWGCEQATLNSRNALTSVDVSIGGGVQKSVVLESASGSIENNLGSLHIEAGTFHVPVVLNAQEDLEKQALHIEIIPVGARSEDVELINSLSAQEDMLFCLKTDSPEDKDILLTQVDGSSPVVHDGFVLNLDLCLTTRETSVVLKIIDEAPDLLTNHPPSVINSMTYLAEKTISPDKPLLLIAKVKKGETLFLYTDVCETELLSTVAKQDGDLEVEASLDFEGLYHMHAKVLSVSGVLSECSTAHLAYLYDETAPSGASLILQSGAAYTTSQDLSLELAAIGAVEMKVSDGNQCLAGVWESYSTSKTWTLTTSNSLVDISVQFKDKKGNQTSCLSRQIFHDDTSPSTPSSFNDGVHAQSANLSPSFTWDHATDVGSGVAFYEISIGLNPGETDVREWTNIGYVTSASISDLSLTPGTTYYANIRSYDSAGHVSSITSGDGFFLKNRQNLVATGHSHSCSLLEDGHIKCWGINDTAQLGVGHMDNLGDNPSEMGSALPVVDLGTGRTATQITSSDNSTCALLDNNDLKCWGSNVFGQLGQGSISLIGDQSSDMGDNLPSINLGTGRHAVQVSTSNSTCARLDNGDIKCWGSNFFGQLGRGDTDDIGDQSGEMGDNLPAIDLGNGRTSLKVSTGAHICALMDNHQIRCWGNNNNGQLGLGHTNKKGDEPSEMGDSLPIVDLGTGRTAFDVVVGGTHSCALLDTFEVKCWGGNFAGNLGLGHMDNMGDNPSEMGDNLPTINLGTGRTAVSIAAHDSVTCAILDTGDVKCWGNNHNGLLGQGHNNMVIGISVSDMGDNLPTVNLGTARTAIDLSVNHMHMCAKLDNEDVKCWGYNFSGQLGQGNTSSVGENAADMGDNLPAIDL